MVIGRPVRVAFSALATCALVTATAITWSGVSAATPSGWTGPTPIPHTTGVVNQVFATAPNGTDLLLWVGPGTTTGTAKMSSRVRLAGSTAWLNVPTHLDNQYNIQEYSLAAAPNGDFWVAFVQYRQSTGFPEVYAMRFDHRTHRWSKKTQIFHSATYHHGGARLAVGGDGSVYIGAYAPPVTPPSGNPGYRTVVAVKSPGSSHWQSQYLSAKTVQSSTPELAANAKGQVVASWIVKADQLSTMTVRAATRAPGRTAQWHASTLSVPGDSQRSLVGIGGNGTAEVVWLSPASGPYTAIRSAKTTVRSRGSSWTEKDVVTGGGFADPRVTVNKDGVPTVVYRQSAGGGAVTLETTNLTAGSWSLPATLSPNTEITEIDGLVSRTSGNVAVLYRQLDTAFNDLGLRIQKIGVGPPGPVEVISTSSDPAANAPALGVTASGGSIAEWQYGPYPGNKQAWSGSALRAPKVVADAFSAKPVRHTTVSGSARSGRRVTCTSGYWVEANNYAYRWLRDGHTIRGATSRRYRLTSSDHGHRVSCTLTAGNASPQSTELSGRGVRVH